MISHGEAASIAKLIVPPKLPPNACRRDQKHCSQAFIVRQMFRAFSSGGISSD